MPRGRPKGSPNKATIERRLAAEIDVARRANERGVKELGVDVLERMMRLAEGAASLHRPPTPEQVRGAQAQEDAAAAREKREPRKIFAGNWDLFGAWFDRTVFCAKEMAKYQSPTYKAIAVMTPPPAPALPAKGDNVVRLDDPQALARVYANRVKAVR